MSMVGSVCIIHNPVAGRGRSAKRIGQLVGAMQEAGIAHDLAVTGSPGQAVALASQAKQGGAAVIVAAGGDGTLHEVINGVAAVTPADEPVGPIALYPIGSGNDFAHTMKTTADPRTLVQAITSERTRRVDLGLATLTGPSGELHRYFNNSLGFGLEASVTRESDRIQRLSGSLLYVAAAFRALKSYDMPLATIEWFDEHGIAGNVEQQITLMSVGNAKRTGGTFYLTPDADVEDGLFDVALAGAMSRMRLLSLLPRALVGKHTGAASVRILRCRQIRARSLSPLPVHMDGEVVMYDATQAEAVVQPVRLVMAG